MKKKNYINNGFKRLGNLFLKIIIIKMEKKVLLKLFKAMLKKKIKIKKTRTSDLYERRRKNKQSYTLKMKKKMKKNLKKMK